MSKLLYLTEEEYELVIKTLRYAKDNLYYKADKFAEDVSPLTEIINRSVIMYGDPEEEDEQI
jgi:hypothetical protein